MIDTTVVTTSSGCVFRDLETVCQNPSCIVCNHACLECGEPLDDGRVIVEVPGYPGRYAHRSCRFTVISTAFAAVGL